LRQIILVDCRILQLFNNFRVCRKIETNEESESEIDAEREDGGFEFDGEFVGCVLIAGG
jgi:hypothetical protein